MICSECEDGKVFHPMAHVRASKNYGKHIPCPKCNGLGITYYSDSEGVSQPNLVIVNPQHWKS